MAKVLIGHDYFEGGLKPKVIYHWYNGVYHTDPNNKNVFYVGDKLFLKSEHYFVQIIKD